MAAEVGSAYISLLPSMQGFGSKVNKEVGGISERAGREGGARFGKVWASTSIAPMRAIGAAAVGLFAGAQVAGFFKESIAGARESAKIGALTAQVIKTTGAAANVSAAQVGNLAAAISNKTGVDDEAIQSGQNLLLTFTNVQNKVGKGNDIFNQATRIMTDMSVALGTDAKGSAIQLGKALNDPVKGVSALQRVGVSFTATQKKQIEGFVKSGDTMKAQKVILAELGKEFGGAAAAAGTPADRARAAWGNFQEFIGAKMIPVADKLSTFFTGTLLPGLQATFTAFESGKASGSGFIGFMSQVGVKAQQFGAFFSTSVVPVLKDFGNFLTSTVIPALASLGGFITGTVVPALVSFAGWVQRNATTIGVIAGIIGTLLIPYLITLGVQAAVSAAKQVAAWVMVKVNAVTSAAAQVAASYRIVAGWVASGAAAVRSGAQTVAIWAMYKAEAVKGAAATVAAHARIAASWIASTARSAAAAVASGASVIASYVAQGAAATASGAVQAAAWVRATAAIVANRAVMVAAAVATGVMTAAQWALNVAMTANPIGLVIAAIVLLVGGLILAYKKSETFRNIVNAVFGAVKTFVISAVGAIRSVVVSVFGFLKAYFTTVFNIYRTIIVGAWTGIKVAVAAAVGFVRGYFRLVGAAAQMVAGFFTSMAASVRARVSAVVSVVGSMASRVIGFIKGIPGKILGIGGQIVDGLANGIRNAASRVMDAVRSLVDKIPKKIRELLGIASPSKVTAELGKWVGVGLAVGINSSTKDVVRAGEKMADSLRKAMVAKTPGATSTLLRTIDRENRQLGRLATQRDAVTKRLAAATKTYTDLVNARTDYAGKVAENARSFAAITAVESGASAKGILANLRSRMVQVQKFADLIKSLKAQGLNATTLDQIVQAGVEQGSGIAVALAKGGSAAIAETNTLQAGISSAAASLGSTAGSAMYDAGVKAAAGIVRGLQSQEKVLAAQMARLAKIMASQIKRSLGIRSPSRVMADEVGRFIPAGIAVGIARHAGLVRSEMDRLAMVPRVAAVRRPLVTAGASSAPVRGGDTYVVHSRAEDPAEVARLVSANNAWHHR